MRGRLAIVVATMLLAGCTGDDHRHADLVTDGAVDNPYSGPLYVSKADSPKGSLPRRTGAAGTVVDCASRVTGSFEDGAATGAPLEGGVAGGPIEGLRFGLSERLFDGAWTDFRMERRDDDRVLFTFDAGRETKQAVIVHKGEGYDGQGWYVESWARCDLSEFPESVTEPLGLQIWTDAGGNPAPTYDVVSYLGPAHCDWQDMTFLRLPGRGPWVRQPQAELRDFFAEPYRDGVPLPKDAIDTGYDRAGNHLWVSADAKRAYIGDRDSVEVWPRTIKQLGCL